MRLFVYFYRTNSGKESDTYKPQLYFFEKSSENITTKKTPKISETVGAKGYSKKYLDLPYFSSLDTLRHKTLTIEFNLETIEKNASRLRSNVA